MIFFIKLSQIFFFFFFFCCLFNTDAMQSNPMASFFESLMLATNHTASLYFDSPYYQREPSYLFGISSVDRPGVGPLYLHRTLTMLFSPSLNIDLRVVVFLADETPAKRRAVIDRLKVPFSLEIQQQRLIFVELTDPASWYPPALRSSGVARCQLRRNHGDALLRVLYRSKLVLDFAFLLSQAHALLLRHHLAFFVLLEDDTPFTTAADFVSFHVKFRSFLSSNPAFLSSRASLALRAPSQRLAPFSQDPFSEYLAGNFGFLLHPDRMLHMSDWLRKEYDVAPADWLFGRYHHEVFSDDLMSCCYWYGKDVLTHIGKVSTKLNHPFLNRDLKPPECFQTPTSDQGPFVCWDQCDQYSFQKNKKKKSFLPI